MTDYIWEIRYQNGLIGEDQRSNLREVLAQNLAISSATAQILINRGVVDVCEGRDFLEGNPRLNGDPFALRDMDCAVARINQSISSNEKILISGDYDADGVTGTALLTWCLRHLGACVDYYIPHRDEGYGLNERAILEAKQQGVTLIITVDCGITAVSEVILARSLGIDVIITDHHQCQAEIPACIAAINPNRPDCEYPYKAMAGVGVAYKLCQALIGTEADRMLDLVALGTVADSVPLLEENRKWVKDGLRRFGENSFGLQSLIMSAGFSEKPITADAIAYYIAPRINAAGRLTSAMSAVELLLAADPEIAAAMAIQLESENKRRQEMEAAVFEAALADAKCQIESGRLVPVVSGARWHPGVIGISAAKISEYFNRPVFIISVDDGDGRGRGSVRGIPGFNVYNCLDACSHLLARYGGHAGAGGFGIDHKTVEKFAFEVDRFAEKHLDFSAALPKLDLEFELKFGDISCTLPEEICQIEPFGTDNPQPVFASRGVEIVSIRTIGKSNAHLKMRFRQDGIYFDAVGFRMAQAVKTSEGLWDIAYQVQRNTWNGKSEIELIIKDVKKHLPVERPYSLDSQILSSTITCALRSEVDRDPILDWICDSEDVLANEPGGPFSPLVSANYATSDDEHDKIRYILSLRSAYHGIVAYTNTRQQAIELAIALEKRLPESDKVWFYDHNLPDEWRYQICDFNVNCSVIICTANPADLFNNDYCRPKSTQSNIALVFYSPPFSHAHMMKIMEDCGVSQEKVGICHFIFGQKDIGATAEILDMISTGKPRLTTSYRLLNRHAASDTGVSKSYIIDQISKVHGAYGELAACIDIEVFKQVELVEEKDDGRLFLHKPSCGKVDLTDSQLFRVSKTLREEYYWLMNEIINDCRAIGGKE